jgi:diguanylate cyclase (GGDEF)-like protein/PAS domain S-box-containing protein
MMLGLELVALFNRHGEIIALNHNVAKPIEPLQLQHCVFTSDVTPTIFTSSSFALLLRDCLAISVSVNIQGKLHLGEIRAMTSVLQSEPQYALVLHPSLFGAETLDYVDARSYQLVQKRLESIDYDFRHVMDLTPAITYKIDLDSKGTVSFITSSVERLLGYASEEIVGIDEWWLDHIHPEDSALYRDRIANYRHADANVIIESEYRFKAQDGQYVWLADRARVVHSNLDSHLHYLIGSVVNITELVYLSKRLDTLAEVSPGVIFQFERRPDGIICFPYASKQLETMFGISPSDAMHDGTSVFAAIHPDDVEQVDLAVLHAEKHLSPWECEFRVGRGDNIRWIYGHSIPVKKHDGKYVWAGLLIDISEKKQLEIKLKKESTTDPLTGVFNRRYFMQRLGDEIRKVSIDRRSLSVLAIDFDHFKKINDRYGHDAGDQVLKEVTAKLEHHIRKTDILARMGGEEFSIILPNTDYGEAKTIAEKLRSVVAQDAISHEHDLIPITITIGVSATDNGYTDESGLLRRADRALYFGKESGRNRVI